MSLWTAWWRRSHRSLLTGCPMDQEPKAKCVSSVFTAHTVYMLSALADFFEELVLFLILKRAILINHLFLTLRWNPLRCRWSIWLCQIFYVAYSKHTVCIFTQQRGKKKVQFHAKVLWFMLKAKVAHVKRALPPLAFLKCDKSVTLKAGYERRTGWGKYDKELFLKCH